MGAVWGGNQIPDAVRSGPEEMSELFHGYTYSGHPVACAAGLATLDIYEEENLFNKSFELGDYWQEQLHSLKEFDVVKDIRNYGLVGAVEFHTGDKPGQRGYDVFEHCFWKGNVMVRYTMDILAMSPPLIVEKEHIDEAITAMRNGIKALY
jgi:beta-alanine--pyruvate transaminase